MKIWKLTPIDLSHRDWETSKYSGEIIVRAESEERVRKFLTDKLCMAATKPPGDEIPKNPWSQHSPLVSAVEVKDESYPKTGKEEILDPEEARCYNDA